MAYNKTSEERKWNYWKEQEKKKLREQGMEEEKIQKLRQMDRALEQQAGMIDPKRYIGDIVMKNQIELLEQQVRELKREKEQLEKENIRLQKALNKKGKRLNFRHGYKNPRPHFCNRSTLTIHI